MEKESVPEKKTRRSTTKVEKTSIILENFQKNIFNQFFFFILSQNFFFTIGNEILVYNSPRDLRRRPRLHRRRQSLDSHRSPGLGPGKAPLDRKFPYSIGARGAVAAKDSRFRLSPQFPPSLALRRRYCRRTISSCCKRHPSSLCSLQKFYQ